MKKYFIAGNWKMYKTTKEALDFAEEFKKIHKDSDVLVGVCAPFTQLAALKKAFEGTNIKVGAQNMHFASEGAFTGEISADMLSEIGIDYCVIGHSERRQYFNETNDTVNKKVAKCFQVGITPILCIGEVLEEREAGKEYEVVKRQLIAAITNLEKTNVARLVIAYEPVWAIGTGKTATALQADDMCGYIRKQIAILVDDEIAEAVIIQYGGSVKPENASELMNMKDINGALVGGASLKPADFEKIVNF